MSTTLVSPLGTLTTSFSAPVAASVKPAAAKPKAKAPSAKWSQVSEVIGNAFATWASGGHIR